MDFDKINYDDSWPSKDKSSGAIDVSRITGILNNMVRRADYSKKNLEPEQYERMRCAYIYSIISNCEDVCPITGFNTYQMYWHIEHLSTGNKFLVYVAPYFDHDFVVVKFPDKANDHCNPEFTRQFKKDNGEWVRIEYSGLMCEYCE